MDFSRKRKEKEDKAHKSRSRSVMKLEDTAK